MKHRVNSLRNVITSKHKRISVMTEGSGADVILLLGRKTSPSPIIEMKPLSNCLKGKYTVVTIDYLGSGGSDNYHCDRTLKNITSEIHEVMEQMNYTSYSIAATAYAGLYSLYYANKYAKEVRAVIGIDAFVSEQDNDWLHKKIVELADYTWQSCHKSAFIQWLVEKYSAGFIKRVKGYTYKDNDVELYSNYAAFRLKHITLLDEYKCSQENFEQLRNITFPCNIPVLFVLSSYRSKRIRNWYKIHQELLQNSCGKIIILKCGKNLHLTQPEKLADQIKSFTPEG